MTGSRQAARIALAAGLSCSAVALAAHPGDVVDLLPSGSIAVVAGSRNLFFHDGVWFRLRGTRFVVTTPPVGVVVPALPAGCDAVQTAGQPYWRCNDLYYRAVPGGGYAVVAPPRFERKDRHDDVPGAAASTPPDAGDIGAERRDCDTWARARPLATSDSAMYASAFESCMATRGHPLR